MIEKILETIQGRLQQAQDRIAQLTLYQALLEQDGIWPALPDLKWEAPEPGARLYLYAYFRKEGEGYLGPAGKKRIYIGREPAKIARAVKKLSNRKRWEQAQEERGRLESLIAWAQDELARIAGRLGHA